MLDDGLSVLCEIFRNRGFFGKVSLAGSTADCSCVTLLGRGPVIHKGEDLLGPLLLNRVNRSTFRNDGLAGGASGAGTGLVDCSFF